MATNGERYSHFSVNYNRLNGDRESAEKELKTIDREIENLKEKVEQKTKRRKQLVGKRDAIESRLDDLIHSFSHPGRQTTPSTHTNDATQAALEEELVAWETYENDDVRSGYHTPATDNDQQFASAKCGSAPDATLEKACEDNSAQQQYEIVVPEYGHIVRIDGSVVAISCFVGDCRANAGSRAGRQHFRGIHGLLKHVRQKHSMDIDIDEVARRCSKAVVTASDLQLIRQGHPPRALVELVCCNEDPKPVQSSTVDIQSIHVYDLPKVNDRFRHIIQVNGCWVELACRLCGANYTRSKKNYFNGVRGFHAHLIGPNHVYEVKVEETLDYCTQRPVSTRDIELMRKNTRPDGLDHQIRKKLPLDDSDDEGPDESSLHRVVKLPLKRNASSDVGTDTVRVSTGPSSANFKSRFDGTSSLMRSIERSSGTGPSASSACEQRRCEGKAPKIQAVLNDEDHSD